MSIFKSGGIDLLKGSLDVYTKQHDAIAENVANATNPEFKRVSTDFSAALKTAMGSKLRISDARHIKGSEEAEAEFSPNTAEEGGSVDITREMGDLAMNQLKFDFAAKSLNYKYSMISQSITGRTR